MSNIYADTSNSIHDLVVAYGAAQVLGVVLTAIHATQGDSPAYMALLAAWARIDSLENPGVNDGAMAGAGREEIVA